MSRIAVCRCINVKILASIEYVKTGDRQNIRNKIISTFYVELLRESSQPDSFPGC